MFVFWNTFNIPTMKESAKCGGNFGQRRDIDQAGMVYSNKMKSYTLLKQKLIPKSWKIRLMLKMKIV